MDTPLSILKQYWKYDHFRPLQEEIIQSAITGHDTLALLPTGGGKSVCFQVPAMMLEGVCVVITPLIALMDDQVEQLRKKGIDAVAIHSGLRHREIDIYLDNAIYGSVKFLYISPERIQTELFIERVKKMKVSLLVVDEAHCISQWGYDFRPAYLQIPDLRQWQPAAPILALTATATLDVQYDIIEKLAFRDPYQQFTGSFARTNLSLVARKTESPEKQVLAILQKVPGTAIIYVRSRKGTVEISRWLTQRGIAAAAYHAGLAMEERTQVQRAWIANKTRVMVATNAFGMGIDKADVRMVIHLDLPENLEAYYQEAGRAGRDGKRAYATVIFHDQQIEALRAKVAQAHPDEAYLRACYQALANYYQLAEGSGAGESYDFDIIQFAERFKLHPQEVYNALRKLEEEGALLFNESFYSPSQLHVLVDSKGIYEFQIANASFDPLIKTLLRLYGGELYSSFVKISEPYLAQSLKITVDDLVKALRHLDQLKIWIYKPTKDKPQVTFVLPRHDAARLPLDMDRLQERKELAFGKMDAIIDWVENVATCRMEGLQEYFGEEAHQPCGICDVCIARQKKDNHQETNTLREEVLKVVATQPISLEDLEEKIAPADHELFAEIVRELLEKGNLEYDLAWRLKRGD